MVVKIKDREDWRICYCPEKKTCNREDHKVYYNLEGTKGKRLKKKVVFSARKVTPQGSIDRYPEAVHHGPGMLDTPSNLKGQW